jgi:ubiquinone/menaquinone biosynthesis C-methylase UbiE
MADKQWRCCEDLNFFAIIDSAGAGSLMAINPPQLIAKPLCSIYMKKIVYNQIGNNYNSNRACDERISNKIINLLEIKEGDCLADIGAGTGNYAFDLAQRNYQIIAIEPSESMLKQKQEHPNINWIQASAEELNISENICDGVYSTLAIHHFDSRREAFHNIFKILKPNQSFVIFSADPRNISPDCWLKDYLGELISKSETSYPEISKIVEELEYEFEAEVSIIPFLIPFNIKDGFFYAGWQSPEKYLNPDFRNSISVFAKFSEKVVNPLIDRLARELKSGIWDEKYGHVRSLKEYDGGYYFAKVKKRV